MITATSKRLDRSATWLGRLLTTCAVLFMAVPALFIAVLSFSEDGQIRFPPREWGLGRYADVFTSGEWAGPAMLSVQVAALTAAGALLLVLPAVFAIHRSALRGRGMLEGAAVAPILFPISAFAVGLYAVFAEMGLLGTSQGIVLAHIVHGIPLVMIILATAMEQLRPELELAAMTLGASRLRAWTGITLRLLTPAIVAAAVFGFVSSFDEAVLITFLGGPGLITLPKHIFDSVQFGVDPAITAVATLLMATTAVLMLIATALRKDAR